MGHRRHASFAGLASALLVGACHFPREPLYADARDAADASMEIAPADVPDLDAETDVRVDARDATDTLTDMGGFDAPVCNALDPDTDGFRVGGSAVVASTTVGQPSLISPPALGGCPSDADGSTSPERIVRYVMRENAWLYATTDAPSCEGIYDTIVHIRAGCTPTSPANACNDDDRTLSSCNTGCTGTDCPGFASSATSPGLAMGQTVYVAVDGYMGHAGRFRLVLTENGLLNAPPPAMGMGVMPADRCACPDPRDNRPSAAVAFPSASDMVRGMGGRLVASGDQISGTRMLPTTSVGGVALRFRLLANGLLNTMTCSTSRMTIDLLVADRVVQSFYVLPTTPAGTTLRVAFQTFASVAIPAMPVNVALRVRDVSVAGCAGTGIDVERAPPGELVLLGR